jgi:hypothetical protein
MMKIADITAFGKSVMSPGLNAQIALDLGEFAWATETN